MELISQYRRQSATAVASLHFPAYVWIALFVLTGITGLVAGVITMASREISDPFSAFSDLFGDDATQAALARGFTCRQSEPGSDLQNSADFCVQRDVDDRFSGIYVYLSANIVNEIRFSLQENTLKIGDLAVLWGEPDIRRYCEAVVVSWPNRHIMALVAPPRSERIGYFSPIASVTFRRSGLSHLERALMNDVLHRCD
ncbi:MAG: hypothetical protein H7175_14545 [Burkholderiales bacterium]|nr:hypothetical protein [Anaerolineae bacterium]